MHAGQAEHMFRVPEETVLSTAVLYSSNPSDEAKMYLRHSGAQTDGTHWCLYGKLETQAKPDEKRNTMNPRGEICSL